MCCMPCVRVSATCSVSVERTVETDFPASSQNGCIADTCNWRRFGRGVCHRLLRLQGVPREALPMFEHLQQRRGPCLADRCARC